LYNSIIVAKMRVSEALSQIDVQLKRRTDLIPNLVETVKGYAKHEKELFEKVTEARASLVSAKGPGRKKQKQTINLVKHLNQFLQLRKLIQILKASQNLSNLQEEISDTEDKIAYARQFYNSIVLDYNTKLKVFPNVIFAKAFELSRC
jgi:LemA protein